MIDALKILGVMMTPIWMGLGLFVFVELLIKGYECCTA